jgi:hypothetical protein
MNPDNRANIWKWIVGIYYLTTILLRPGMTCQFPWQEDDVLLFGIIPGLGAIAGLTFYKTRTERLLSWCVFGLAITGVVMSFIPWRQALGIR